MLLKFYEIIKRIENEIGNGAQAQLSIRYNQLVIRVHWWEKDLHFEHCFSMAVLNNNIDENILVNHIIYRAKDAYTQNTDRPPASQNNSALTERL